ncbi:ANTAR domain-containing response regulator [Paracoccus xiamenensis]|uniref:ANTAR domain-containing response regulator n=1 Tax=Paracoccus xiamenensis TaxID=2714901 RepID=UPI001407C716|nr:ANTAR domain-containing protein [Paracoccus xiamenensis]NHF72690.1 ANTAR domain-containing protein [Paracoccus xiamenensis]
MAPTLSIIIVDSDAERARTICDGLADLPGANYAIVPPGPSLARRIAALHPDLVLIDADNASRDEMEELTLASGPMERPVAVFVNQSDSALTRAMVQAGVAAYVVDGLTQARVVPVVDAAIARFNMLQKVRAELDATRAALEDRKVIDRAKGIVMRARNVPEEDAYALMRRSAMEKGRKIAEIARAIVTAAEVLK